MTIEKTTAAKSSFEFPLKDKVREVALGPLYSREEVYMKLHGSIEIVSAHFS
jgi:hypothetical protein